MNAARISARPPTPTAAQATAVNTTAAVPSSSPPRTKSTPWTVRVEVSAAPGAESAATPAAVGGTGPTRTAGRATTEVANPARTTAASSARRRDVADRRPANSVYVRRARSTSGSSWVISLLSRHTSAAIGSGARRQPVQPVLRSAGAAQAGQG